MFESVHSDRVIQLPNRTARLKQVAAPDDFPAFFLHQLNKSERLFSAGERKRHLYRVESGLLSVSWLSPDGAPVAIETIGPNAFFGLGYLETHLYEAVALADSMVSCWPLESLAFIIDQFPGARDRQNDAVEREFKHRRASFIAAAPTGTPAARLASFLVVVARMNAGEGRDPHIIGESMRCPVVADYLKIDIDTLSDALLELHRAGLIAAEAQGKLRILNLQRLESYPSGSAASPVMAVSPGVEAYAQ